MNNIGNYSKSIMYIALAAATFLVTALSDDNLSQDELVNLGIVVVGAIGVYWAPNLSANVTKYFKTAVAFVTAALVSLLSFLSDGISTTEWLQIGIAALAAIGVFIVPNVKQTKPVVIQNLTLDAGKTSDGYHG